MDIGGVSEQLIVFIAAVIANGFSALAGGGAGLVQFPVLIFLGLPFTLALATHKVATVALGIGATLRNMRESQMERDFALYLILLGIPAVVIGAYGILQAPERPSIIALGILTMGLGLYSIFQPGLGEVYQPKNRDRKGYIIGGAILWFIAMVNGSLSSGTGLFVTMLLIRWFGLDYKRAIAYTMLVVGLCWNAAGGVSLALMTEVKWAWMPALLVGALMGGYFGAHVAILKGNLWVKRSFEVLTILIGAKLLFWY